ncbi:histone-lysine N-methyltransferase SETMAR-like [Ooceraea biroi]|uniref:histone-lysine N-methyltransferase SETMAR-like n=1 Tax=Ooceraea biroi TaxID=2015173 RepID=UPI000F07446F|nr:histone-lysine N-methyltransferase SETMAR-like [Ooceraea biroi]
MEQNKQYFRYLMLFYFHKRKNATQTKEKIRAVYGEDAVSERVCQNRFVEFRASDTCEDGKRSGRPLVADDDQIKTLIENNPHYTTRDIAQIVNVSQKTVVNRLHTLGYVSRYDIWAPHNLTEKHLMDRISICDSLLKRNENNPFLKRIVTGDEKWIVYKNVERKRSWGKRDEPPQTTPKQTIHTKKSYCAFGGIGKESYIMNCFHKIKQLIRRSTVPNCTS